MNAFQAPQRDRGQHPTLLQQYRLAPLHPNLYIDHNVTCHFLKLPPELRQEIFKYFIPKHPIDQNSSVVCRVEHEHINCAESSRRDKIATPLLNLLLGVNWEIYHEVKDVLHSTATFVIHIDKDGVRFCDRRILGPLGPVGQDGSVYLYHNEDPRAIGLFIQQFPWEKIRNYQINLVFGQDSNLQSSIMRPRDWDAEVELYDMRDYAAVVVSGILSKARRLDRLQVRVKIMDSHLYREFAFDEAKLLIEPFERLRCVRNPQLMGMFRDERFVDMYCRHGSLHNRCRNNCVPPPLPAPVPLLVPGMPSFDQVAIPWEQNLALEAPFTVVPSSPLTKLFVEFKEFHNKLTAVVPGIARARSQCFLHRARVAREREDVVHFRILAAELMACWRHHVQLQEAQKQEVNSALERMMAADTYLGGRGAMLHAKQAEMTPRIKQER